MKTCPCCGASLHPDASFCPFCAKSLNERRRLRLPRRLPRRAACSALILGAVLLAVLAGWLHARPKVYDNGTAEVVYTDRDGAYQVLVGFGADRFTPVPEVVTECEEGEEYRMPSRLYVNHRESGANAREEFLEKAESVTAELVPAEDSPSPWRRSQPEPLGFAPEAALVSLLDYTSQSGPAELVWTLAMKNGDTIRLHQRMVPVPIPTYHYYPEDAPMETAEDLQALVDRIGTQPLEEDAVIYLHLPPVTYEGGLTMERRAINLIGSEGQAGRTTFTGTIWLSPAMDTIVYFEHIDFAGSRDSVGISSSARLHLTDCRLSGWKTGLLGYGNAWVNADETVFEDNTVGLHLNISGSYVTDRTYADNLFRNNETAVLLEHISTDVDLCFPGTRFTGNGTDIDNRCGQNLDTSDAIFG